MATPAGTSTARRAPGPTFGLPVLEATLAGAPALIALTALSQLRSLTTESSASTVTAIWGLVLLTSFAGWGAAVNVLTTPERRFDLGMRMALGVGVHLMLGGLLALVSLVSKGMIVATVVGGIVCQGWFEWRWRREVLRDWARASRIAWDAPLFALAMLALVAAALVQYFDSAIPYSSDFNANDDGAAYFGFARQMLGSGTLIEPFSLRRIASLGGQTYLHASSMVFAWVSQLHLVDRGLSLVVMCALVVGVLKERPKTGRLAVILALTVVIALPNTRINTSSQMSGAALLFALYRLLSGRYAPALGGVRSALLVGLVGAGACTLRQNYILPVGLVVAFFCGARFATAQGEAKLLVLRQAAILAGVSLALLLPWMLLSYRSDRTLLFPLMKGDFRPDFAMLQETEGRVARFQFLLKNMFYDWPVRPFGLFVLAGAVAVDRRPGRPLPAFIAAVLLGGLGLVRSFQLSDPPNLSRYFWALESALVVAVIIDLVGRTSHRGRRDRAAYLPAALVITAVGLFLLDVKPTLATAYDRWLTAFDHFSDPPGITLDQADPNYYALQQSVPPGETLLVMLDAPYRLDFKRNRIFNFDIPGAVSPAPGVPIFDGPEAFASYLTGLSIRYVAFLHDTTSFQLYQRAQWERQQNAKEAIWQMQAPFYLAAFSNFSELVQTRKHLYEHQDCIVLDLATPQ